MDRRRRKQSGAGVVVNVADVTIGSANISFVIIFMGPFREPSLNVFHIKIA